MSNGGIKMSNKKEIVDKLRELYVLRDKIYIYQPRYIWNIEEKRYKRNSNGDYSKVNLNDNKYKNLTKKEYKKRTITASLNRHIKEDSNFTLGIFGGEHMSKFICFDVDYPSMETSKFIAKKILEVLKEEVGINDCYISYSGNKGFHIEIFFEDLIENVAAKALYDYVVESIGVTDKYFKEMFKGNVEKRGTTYLQGVKIPLGIHQKTLKYCCYCTHNMKYMSVEESQEYILTIKKISHQIVYDFLHKKGIKINGEREPTGENNPTVKQYIQGENILDKLKRLDIYDPNFDMMEEKILSYLNTGLKYVNTRHDVTFIIALYFKWLGYAKDQMELELLEWLKRQTGKYTTSEKDALKDTLQIIKDVIEKSYTLKAEKKEDVEITFNEFSTILTKVNQKNEKLLMFALIVHAKYCVNSIERVFYMSYPQMAKVTGLDAKTCERIIPRLVSQGVLEVVEKNRKKEGTFIKLPCKFKITLAIEVGDTANIIYISDLYNKKEKDFTDCLNTFYTKQEVKKMLPRRQFEALYAS
jgi:DNA primase catalytic subunit